MDGNLRPKNLVDPIPDRDAVIKACLDYAEGWYTGDAERMQRSLHPDLVKRTIDRDPDQNTWQLTRRGMHNTWSTSPGGRRSDITGRDEPAWSPSWMLTSAQRALK